MIAGWLYRYGTQSVGIVHNQPFGVKSGDCNVGDNAPFFVVAAGASGLANSFPEDDVGRLAEGASCVEPSRQDNTVSCLDRMFS